MAKLPPAFLAVPEGTGVVLPSSKNSTAAHQRVAVD
jgi:hypothetical protein